MSIFEYDKEEEERKLRKAEFEAGGAKWNTKRNTKEGKKENKKREYIEKERN